MTILSDFNAIVRASLSNAVGVSVVAVLLFVSGCGSSVVPTTAQAAGSSKVARLCVTSSELTHGGECPIDLTIDGLGISPSIQWSGAPPDTKCFVISLWRLNVDKNVDAPWTSSFWLVYNVPAEITHVDKGQSNIGIDGLNDRGKKGYDPLNSKIIGWNEYHLTVYALSQELEFDTDKIPRRELIKAIKGLVIAEGTLDFQYKHLEHRRSKKK
jgi:phosphatidylethanolamine-binding protein (PEBP) family uncharacterized protein